MYAVYSASVVGDSHTTGGKGNEDSLFIGRGNSNWISCVVSDGCGSAKHAAAGSKYIAELVGEALLRVSEKIERKGPGAWITDDIIAELAGCKNKLREIVGSELRDYHATVVAALLSPKGGFLLHIGDGIAANFELKPVGASTVQISQTATSEPENGEYANETFYLTEPSWIRHFRLTPLTSVSCVVLCTDGAQDVLFDRNEVNHEQIKTILSIIKDRPSTAPNLLKDHFLSDFSRKRSSDDKTIAIICGPEFETSLRSAQAFAVPPPTAQKPLPQATQTTNTAPQINTRSRAIPPSPAKQSPHEVNHNNTNRALGRSEHVSAIACLAIAAASLVVGSVVGTVLALILWTADADTVVSATTQPEDSSGVRTVVDPKHNKEAPQPKAEENSKSTGQTQRSPTTPSAPPYRDDR